ncbi:hypothetical protein IPM44_02925 [bacterium]|nr:MAG: hypothetical protein IPM44_02925 [bacterium]
MVTPEQVHNYARQKFNEEDPSDRIEDAGFAYYINTQPREYLDTEDIHKMMIGNGPLVVIKETGDVYSFSSNPAHMFGDPETRIGVNTARTTEEFHTALSALIDKGATSANPIDHIN